MALTHAPALEQPLSGSTRPAPHDPGSGHRVRRTAHGQALRRLGPATQARRAGGRLADADLFLGLDAADVATLCQQFELFDAARGKTLFQEGDGGDSLYVVLDGKVKLVKHDRHGRQSILAIKGPNDHFGVLSILDSGPRAATATTVTDARLARLPKSALERWIAQRPQLAFRLLHAIAARLAAANDMLADLAFVDTPGRLARQLLILAGRYGDVEGERSGLLTRSGDRAEVVDEARRHPVRREAARCQAEGSDVVFTDSGLLSAAAANLGVLHERDPATLADHLQPGHILDVFVCRDAVILGQRDEPEPRLTEERGNLDATQAAVDEEVRQPVGMQPAPHPRVRWVGHRIPARDWLGPRRPRTVRGHQTPSPGRG